MPALNSIPAAHATIKEVLEVLDKDGCIAITNVLDKERSAQLKQQLEDAFEEIPACQGNFFGFATKRMSSVLSKVEVSRDLAIYPLVLEVMDHFLLKSCRQYQLNLTQAIQIFPGEPTQIIHQDDLMFPFELSIPGNQKMINCMWAVDEFTAKNGGTNLVPGSHKWPRDRQPDASEIISSEMPAGSLLIYFGSLLHSGGANRTAKPRMGLVLSYCLGWLRQAENHYLGNPLELVRKFPKELQRLMGYFVHEPNLGALNGRDPIEILENHSFLDQRFEEFIPLEFQEPLREYRKMVSAR